MKLTEHTEDIKYTANDIARLIRKDISHKYPEAFESSAVIPLIYNQLNNVEVTLKLMSSTTEYD